MRSSLGDETVVGSGSADKISWEVERFIKRNVSFGWLTVPAPGSPERVALIEPTTAMEKIGFESIAAKARHERISGAGKDWPPRGSQAHRQRKSIAWRISVRAVLFGSFIGNDVKQTAICRRRQS